MILMKCSIFVKKHDISCEYMSMYNMSFLVQKIWHTSLTDLAELFRHLLIFGFFHPSAHNRSDKKFIQIQGVARELTKSISLSLGSNCIPWAKTGCDIDVIYEQFDIFL